ncbi:MAG: hypothetical protein AAFY78_24505 [Cyanobacteria bacterium J06648_16]
MEEMFQSSSFNLDSSPISENSNPYGFSRSESSKTVGGSSIFWVTNTNDNGEGSLREAVQMANDSAGHDIIMLTNDLENAIRLNTEIVITDDVTIEGNGNKIRGSGEDRLFRIDDGDLGTWSKVEIHDVLLTGGVANGNEAAEAAGGAIYSAEVLTLDEVIVRKNFASRFGAGIFNFQGHLTVKNSVIARNDDIAAQDGTFYGIYGGGIYNYRGTLNLIDTTFRKHDIERCGGSVFNEAGVVFMERTTIRNNAALHGGAILNLNAVTFLNETALVKNTARELGGGIANFATKAPFAGPFGRTEAGGELESVAPSVLYMDSDSVIRQNTAFDFGGGIFNGDDGGFFTEGVLIGVEEGINVLRNKEEDIFGPTQTL